MSELKFSTTEELYAYLIENNLDGIDSEFSINTKELVDLFNAKGAHLNKWWVMTPTYWICPACNRAKSEIVRLNRHEYLSCQLHEHHDHMKDVVKDIFEQISTQMDHQVADEYSERFAIKAAFSLSAYDNTIICSDCNEADKNAKLAVGTHKYFSFSPKEIGEFIICRNNSPHEINELTAQSIWQAGQAIFETRMRFAKNFAEVAATNHNWYQPNQKSAKVVESMAKECFRKYGLDNLSYQPEKLLYQTNIYAGDFNSWRTKPRYRNYQRPTPQQINHLSAVRGSYWNRYEDNWECPCCKRSKLSCVQPSKNNPWVFEAKQAYFFNPETLKQDIVTVCNECLKTGTLLARELIQKHGRTDVISPISLITFDELSSIITAFPHSVHFINNQTADSILPNIDFRLEAGYFH